MTFLNDAFVNMKFVKAVSLVALLAVGAHLTGCVPALVVGGTAAGYYVGNDERNLNEIVDDASITAGIEARYLKDSLVSAWDIDVDTRNGVVTLNGSVSSAEVEAKAIELAKQSRGVKKIISRLTVVERKR